MAEPRDRDPNAPQNPPHSVVRPEVRRTALRTYLTPIVILFALIGLALIYWSRQPPITERAANRIERDDPNAEGTAGERSRGDDTPGGHEPQPTPDSTREELEHRMGRPITTLGEMLEENARGEIGRRVEIAEVTVERVDGPTSFWVKDGNASSVQVVAASATSDVRAGQEVHVTGIVERSGDTVRIRASKVWPSQ